MSNEFGDRVHSIDLAYQEGLVRKIVDLRQNTRRVDQNFYYKELFSLPDLEALISLAYRKGIFPGPIDNTPMGEPTLSSLEGVWSTCLFLSSFLDRLSGTSYKETLRRAINSDRPRAYFMEPGCRLGLFAKLYSTPVEMVLQPTVKDMVPILMGRDWEERIPVSERFDYWGQRNPPAAASFVQTHDIYLIKAACRVILEPEALSLITSLPEARLRELIESVIKGEDFPSDSVEFRYMRYLLQRGFRRLMSKQAWVKKDEWLAEVDKLKEALLQENLPEFFNVQQTLTMALSVPRS